MDHALTDERTRAEFRARAACLADECRLSSSEAQRVQTIARISGARSPRSARQSGRPKTRRLVVLRSEQNDQAVAEWKRALALRADPEVQAALDKAQKDKQEEESYKENEAHTSI